MAEAMLGKKDVARCKDGEGEVGTESVDERTREAVCLCLLVLIGGRGLSVARHFYLLSVTLVQA